MILLESDNDSYAHSGAIGREWTGEFNSRYFYHSIVSNLYILLQIDQSGLTLEEPYEYIYNYSNSVRLLGIDCTMYPLTTICLEAFFTSRISFLFLHVILQTDVLYEQIVIALTMLLDGNTTKEIFEAAQDIVMFETELAKVLKM